MYTHTYTDEIFITNIHALVQTYVSNKRRPEPSWTYNLPNVIQGLPVLVDLTVSDLTVIDTVRRIYHHVFHH